MVNIQVRYQQIEGGVFGGKYFSKTNYHLKNIGKSEIKWV